MSSLIDEDEDFHLVTDRDFVKYVSSAIQAPWKPLDGSRSIRLLKIFSTTRSAVLDKDTIECRLEHWDLDEASGKYEALSYAWGEPGNGFSFIQCNNVTVRIWQNLYDALRRLRDKISGEKQRRTRLIWVDALCIDQTDMNERQRQILLMKSIFGSASQVVIWLGQHDETSQQVWQTIEGVQPGSATEMLRNALQWNVKMRNDFLRRPWFRRVWTLQEIVLSSKATLLCGDDEMDWTIFCTIWKDRYEFMRNLRPEIRERRVDHIQESLDFIGLMNCFDIRQYRVGNGVDSFKTLPLSEVIIRTWYRDATSAYDRIYALLGLIEVSKYGNLQRPDYSQSILKLFIDVTRTAMNTDKMPALLNIAGLSPDDIAPKERLRKIEPGHSTSRTVQEDLQTDPGQIAYRPSWVPDWRKRGRENNWLISRLASDDREARLQPGLGRYVHEPQTWTPVFTEDHKLIICGHIVGHVPLLDIHNRLRSRRAGPSTFKVTGLSWGSTGQVRWVRGGLGEHETYTVSSSGLPYDGETTRAGDIVCAFEGIRSLFLVRMMFPLHFSTPGALEYLKEDVQYKNLKINCLLIGPVQIEGIELAENPSLGRGYWEFIIN